MEYKTYKPKDIENIAYPSPSPKNCNIKGIIALTGKGGIGKSSSLHELIDLLCPGLIKSVPKDVRISFTYNGNSILVCTAGDNREYVELNCKLAEFIHPDVFVSAVNYQDGATRAFDYYSEKKKVDSFIQLKICKESLNKRCNGSVAQQNTFAANELKKIIDTII